MSQTANRTRYLSLSEASVQLGYPPRKISTAIYSGWIDVSTWPVVGGRRLVPADELDAVREAIEAHRAQPRQQSAAAV
jgi:hypothetical protein